MPIHILPEYLINRLKAWEIVERPSAVLKELIENSLDAWATQITISINEGWKSLISVEDNWYGIELSDMDLIFERYATSKINGEQDLYNLQSYGFRGEALASISEVSKTTIISKTVYAEIWTKLSKIWQDIKMLHVPVWFKNWTIIQVQDLFYNVPARLKFLKSSQTEFFYCYNYFVDVALYHHDINFIFKKNDKVVFELPKCNGIMDRIGQLFKKDWSKNLKEFEYQDEDISVQWLISNNQILFWSWENIRIYFNWRPIQDKIIKKALMDAYYRQITPWEFPFAVILIKSRPWFTDVNVHPRKLEVKFVDPRKIYDTIYTQVKKTLWDNKISTWNISTQEDKYWISSQFQYTGKSDWNENLFTWQFTDNNVTTANNEFSYSQENLSNSTLWSYKILWQLRNSYIVIQSEDGIYYVDQHALAERIAFEKMKKETKENKLIPEILLQPIIIPTHQILNIEDKLNQINLLWFDCGLLSEDKIIIYSVPQIFVIHKVDIEKLFNHILYLDEIKFDHILDKMFASNACKTSIKVWDKLSYPEMENLIKEGFENVDGMFVCQHGRPSFVKISKIDIDKLFDRN